MDPRKKGNLLVIFTIAIIAFGTSTAVASVSDTGAILKMLNINTSNGTTELVAVGDGNFSALTANQVVVQVQNVTNVTNITNITNNTNNTRNVTNGTSVVTNNNNNNNN